MKPLPQKYDHKETEKRWQHAWEEDGTYHWDESQPRANTFVIDTPPPTVSGLLHMGHIYSYTQADYIARHQRMAGKTVFYPMGFDDNGLPTERLVEKAKKVRATDLSREEFITLCEGVSEEARADFRELFKTTALSVDWRQEYHTVSAESRKISQLSFLDLFHKGHAYRDLRPMLWDPIDQTAIAQAEVVDKEIDSFENILTFGLDDGSGERVGEFTVMTTRPEMLPACVAVMCPPEEAEKYKGMQAIRPISGMRVPIIADEKVDREKGTGMVMCCMFGDETDIHWYNTYRESHNLPYRVILNRYGKLDKDFLDSALGENPKKTGIIELVGGLKVTKARDVFIEKLKETGELADRNPIKHAVKCAERSGAPLELLPTQQWFVRVLDKKDALKAKAAECNWHPAWMKTRMDQWIDGLNWDWCISRQRYFGVPFPVWYIQGSGDGSQDAKITVARPEDLPVNPLVDAPHGYEKLEVLEGNSYRARNMENGEEVVITPEADVMDTWATSSVSPQLSSKGITSSPVLLEENTKLNPLPLGEDGEAAQLQAGEGPAPQSAPQSKSLTPSAPLALSRGERENPYLLDPDRHEKLFPADLRPQAHEIIRTWAFYTVVKAHLHENTIPWKSLMISGWCLAEDKTKMSKSKGNVVTPIALIEEHGADVVRYWSSTSRLGADTAFSKDLLKIGRKLVTKLWNATKFAAIHLDKIDAAPGTAAEDIKAGRITETLDLWILTRLHRAVQKATEQFETFEYSDARASVEDFFWNDFCDNYLELVKRRVYGEDHSPLAGESQSASRDAVGGEQTDMPPHDSANASSAPPQGGSSSVAGQRSAAITIYHCLDGILRLFAPILPHITEELWSHIFEEKHTAAGSIHARGNWPQASAYPLDEQAEASGIATVAILETIRKAKSEKGVSIKYPLEKVVVSAGNTKNTPLPEGEGGEAAGRAGEGVESTSWTLLEGTKADLEGAGNITALEWQDTAPENAATTEDGRFALAITFAKASDAA